MRNFYREWRIKGRFFVWICRDSDWTGIAEWRWGLSTPNRTYHFKFSNWEV